LELASKLSQGGAIPGDLRAAILHNRAAVEMKTGDYGMALSDSRAALEIWQDELAPNDLNLMRARASLASLEFLAGDRSEAQRLLEQAIGSARQTLAPNHPTLADLLASDAIVLDALKRKREAKAALEEARRIRSMNQEPAPARTSWDINEALAPDSAVYLRSK
jgi:tetratricopeptide (TPR) repeat protein